ncbi:MAG TPA: lipase family protein [Bryobacteraceae bacterium]|jgi:predicted lipase|nr:lipase family protein [Bryobacteraceae bacterium]
MGFDKTFAVNVMYPCASGAYLVMNLPTPPLALPPGFALCGLISANPQHAAAAMAVADPDHQRLANKMVQESSIFGFVAWDAVNQAAIVAIRGTQTIWDWMDDVDAAPVPCLAVPGAGLVHMGFQLVHEHIHLSIKDLLTKNCQGAKTIWITGHSLGGALAVLCAYDLLKNLNLGGPAGSLVPKLYTFAGPRTLDPAFAAKFNTEIPDCNRIVNFMDVVPQVPVPPVYKHVGAETLVHGGFRPLDITYAHHLTTYLAGMNSL